MTLCDAIQMAKQAGPTRHVAHQAMRVLVDEIERLRMRDAAVAELVEAVLNELAFGNAVFRTSLRNAIARIGGAP